MSFLFFLQIKETREQPGTLCKEEASGTTVRVLPQPRRERAIVCLACGLSCILQKGKGGGRDLEGREGGELGEEEEGER